MGLSSSQARLLTLTGRMHDIEYKAQRLEAQKLRLANDSRRVYENYLDALETVKIQSRVLLSDGSFSYDDATYNRLVGTKVNDHTIYVLRDIETGKAFVDEEYKCAYDASNKTLGGFLRTLNSIKSGASASYTSITSADQLLAMSGSSGNFRLDCDLTVTNWDGIQNFSGTFDGNGHTITIKNGTCGLFDNTNGATIRNIAVDANINSDRNYAGGLIRGAKNTTIENASTTGYVEGPCGVGGFIGYAMGGTVITNCTSSADVYANRISASNGYDEADKQDYKSFVGGFVGCAGENSSTVATINDCSSSGNVKSEYWFVGGFSGYIHGNVVYNNCESSSNVWGNCNGRGDDFKAAVEGLGITFVQSVSTFNGATSNNKTIVINNCNALGNAYAGGNPIYSKIDDFTCTTPYSTFNNFYSTLDGTTYTGSTKNVYTANTDASAYPNLTESDIEKAIDIFSILDKTNGGVVMPEDQKNSVEWLTNMVNNGFALISQVDVSQVRDYSVYDVSVAIDTNLREIEDEQYLRKAEAQYEADMRKIDMKDRKYDTDLAALESERNAIKAEMETLKTVAKDNVERTFKLFS
ncbi:MAG: hypothetical protein K6E29_02265 [Cyanobacteria bacterium RUI128]|nr:hypothetical protein [Cyanobacteria bacterium RUI128]